jgi:hypothetical protein
MNSSTWARGRHCLRLVSFRKDALRRVKILGWNCKDVYVVKDMASSYRYSANYSIVVFQEKVAESEIS